MKKFFAVVLALLMVLCATAGAEEISYVGYWGLTDVSMAGVSVDPSTLNIDAAIQIREDGTCEMLIISEESSTDEEGTWVATETGVSMTDESGDVQELTYADGKLSMEEAGMTMVFTHQESVQILSGLTLEDFRGQWIFSHVELLTYQYTAEEVGLSMTIDLQGDTAHIDMTTEEGTTSMDGVCELVEDEEDGSILNVDILDATTGEPDGTGLMLLMYDDGMLVWYNYDEETEVWCFYCFNRAE